MSCFLQSGDCEVLLEDPTKSIFHYVQLLHTATAKGDRLRRIWDPTYTLVYQNSQHLSVHGWSVAFVTRHLGTDRLPKGELIQYLQKKSKVRLPKILLLTNIHCQIVRYKYCIARNFHVVKIFIMDKILSWLHIEPMTIFAAWAKMYSDGNIYNARVYSWVG